MREVVRTAEGLYELVVIDTPPTSVVSDAIPLVNEVTGVIVVGRLDQTTRDSATHLAHQLENLGGRVLGVVVNHMRSGGATYGYGYYGAGRGAFAVVPDRGDDGGLPTAAGTAGRPS
jgi:Mrp family chromosome partitioning ATPase